MVRDRENYMDTLHDQPSVRSRKGRWGWYVTRRGERSMRSVLSQKVGISPDELNEVIPVSSSSTAWLSFPPQYNWQVYRPSSTHNILCFTRQMCTVTRAGYPSCARCDLTHRHVSSSSRCYRVRDSPCLCLSLSPAHRLTMSTYHYKVCCNWHFQVVARAEVWGSRHQQSILGP
jgi:hypothetical protein